MCSDNSIHTRTATRLFLPFSFDLIYLRFLALDCRLKRFTFSKRKSIIQHCIFSE